MRLVRFASVLLVVALFSAAQAQTFNVFAAASLKESATEIGRQFENKYPNYVVSINFGGSQQLAAQIRVGAPVDVFLSAGMAPLKSLNYDKASLRVFALNELALVVPANSNKVRSLADLGRGIRLILADTHVPVGGYGEQMLAKARRDLGVPWLAKVHQSVISREQDVRAVLTKVELGEADAGIVYVSDAMHSKGKVRVISIPAKYNVLAEYPAVRFADSLNADVAKDFMVFLLGKEAQAILRKHGFRSPVNH